jgi:hypothetical protein
VRQIEWQQSTHQSIKRLCSPSVSSPQPHRPPPRMGAASWLEQPQGGISFCINFGDIICPHCPRNASLHAVLDVFAARPTACSSRCPRPTRTAALTTISRGSGSPSPTRTTPAESAGRGTTPQPRRQRASSRRTTLAPTGSPALRGVQRRPRVWPPPDSPGRSVHKVAHVSRRASPGTTTARLIS